MQPGPIDTAERLNVGCALKKYHIKKMPQVRLLISLKKPDKENTKRCENKSIDKSHEANK